MILARARVRWHLMRLPLYLLTGLALLALWAGEIGEGFDNLCGAVANKIIAVAERYDRWVRGGRA